MENDPFDNTSIAVRIRYCGNEKTKKLKLRGLNPQANYTNQATAAVGEVVPTFCG
jgi:hypothetical protein